MNSREEKELQAKVSRYDSLLRELAVNLLQTAPILNLSAQGWNTLKEYGIARRQVSINYFPPSPPVNTNHIGDHSAAQANDSSLGFNMQNGQDYSLATHVNQWSTQDVNCHNSAIRNPRPMTTQNNGQQNGNITSVSGSGGLIVEQEAYVKQETGLTCYKGYTQSGKYRKFTCKECKVNFRNSSSHMLHMQRNHYTEECLGWNPTPVGVLTSQPSYSRVVGNEGFYQP